MKNLIVSFLFISFSCTLFAKQVPCPAGTTAVSPCFTRGAQSDIYAETAISDLSTVIPRTEFQALIDAFRADSTAQTDGLNQYEIAGFCFLPEVKKEKKPGNIIEFETKGLKINLVLWRYSIVNGLSRPTEVKFYGYTAAGEDIQTAMSLTKTGGVKPNMDDYETVITLTGAAPLINADDLILNSREFDLVFLDYENYRYLSGGDFYLDEKSSSGLTVKRAFKSMDPHPDTDTIFTYRTLSFQPDPLPELPAYESENALAYNIGIACPPYWKEEGFTLREIVGSTRINGPVKYLERTVVEKDSKPLWWEWLLLLLAVVILLLQLIMNARINNSGGELGNRLDKEIRIE